MSNTDISIPLEVVSSNILLIRGQKVMLDFTLAEMYEVKTHALNQAVTRNIKRFPDDFMFRLSLEEFENLNLSQIVIGSQKHRDPNRLPRAFTQEGIGMLSGILRSEKAITVNIAIMRAFVEMREAMLSHKEMAQRLDKMESKYDGKFKTIFDALRQILETPVPKKNPIGYIRPVED